MFASLDQSEKSIQLSSSF